LAVLSVHGIPRAGFTEMAAEMTVEDMILVRRDNVRQTVGFDAFRCEEQATWT
jgi:hypothetical protein